MPNYRRARIPGGTYFFTLVTHGRRPLFANPGARSLLGECFRECGDRWPYSIDALVLLPDHLPAIWSLPRADTDYSNRWGWLKKEFTKRWLSSGCSEGDAATPDQEVRSGVWQQRFWEHVLEDDDDFDRHFDYVHYNPVKHGHARCPRAWASSSFHRWVTAGVYPQDWACGRDAERIRVLSKMAATVGEPADETGEAAEGPSPEASNNRE